MKKKMVIILVGFSVYFSLSAGGIGFIHDKIKIAIQQGDMKNIESLIRQNDPEMIYITNYLDMASQYQRLDMMKLFIANGADLKSDDCKKMMMTFSKNGYLTALKILTENGADINIQDHLSNNSGMSPLMYACRNGHYNVVKYLVGKGAKINPYDDSHFTPLMYAAQSGSYEIVKLLLEKGAKINWLSYLQMGPDGRIMNRQKEANTNIIDLIDKKDMGQTALYIALKEGYYDIADLIINHLDKDEIKKSLLDSFRNGKFAVIKYFFEKKRKLLNDDMLTVLYFASKSLSIYFSEKDKNIDFWNSANYIIGNIRDEKIIKKAESHLDLFGEIKGFHKGLYNVNIIKTMIVNNTIDIKFTDESGRTPLMVLLASPPYRSSDRMNIINYLISKGSDINQKDYYGNCPIKIRINEFFNHGYDEDAKNTADELKLLIDNGADVNAADNFGNTLLHSSIYWDYSSQKMETSFTRTLIEGGADVDLRNHKNETVIYKFLDNITNDRKIGKKAEYLDLLELIIKKMKDNRKEELGKCVLFLADLYYSEDLYLDELGILIENGADVNMVQDQNGCKRTALDYAIGTRNPGIIDILKKAGAMTYEELTGQNTGEEP